MKFQLGNFSLARHPPTTFPLVATISAVTDRPSQMEGHLPGCIWESLGSMWEWFETGTWPDQRKMCVLAGHAAHVWIPGPLFTRFRPLTHFGAPVSPEDPTPTRFWLALVNLSSASGPSPLLSLSLSPVPVKVIREVFSVVEMKVAMTKG